MKRFLALFVALVFWTGARSYADSLVPPAGSTVAWSTATVVVEPFVWPVAPFVHGRKIKVVSGFGRRKIPAIPNLATAPVVAGGDELHEGVDFAVPVGANVLASRSGRVLFAGFSKDYASRADKKEKNHLVIVRHSDGRSTRYVHLA